MMLNYNCRSKRRKTMGHKSKKHKTVVLSVDTVQNAVELRILSPNKR